MKKTTLFFLLVILNSCNLYDDRKHEVFITDKDYVENYRELSPDKSMLLINYSLDLGAFGYGYAGTAILKVSDTIKELRQYSLPNNLENVKWIGNKKVSTKIDIIPSIRKGENIVIKNTKINNVEVEILASDYTKDGNRLKIEHREVSPNGKLEFIAYRYSKDLNNFSPIQISIISVGSKIPKYGNYYIGEKQSDFILFGSWNKQNELVFYSNNNDSEMIKYYLVESRPKIKYSIVKNEQKYAGKYLWKEKSGI